MSEHRTIEERVCPVHGAKPEYGCAECARIHLDKPQESYCDFCHAPGHQNWCCPARGSF